MHKLSWKKNCVLSWMSRRRLSCALRVAPSRPSLSPVCPRSGRPLSHFNPSGHFFSAAYALLFPSLHAGAGVAVHSTAVATTGLRARGRESWATVVPDGVRNGTDLPRGWRPGPHQRHGARPRPWCVQPLGWSATGNHR